MTAAQRGQQNPVWILIQFIGLGSFWGLVCSVLLLVCLVVLFISGVTYILLLFALPLVIAGIIVGGLCGLNTGVITLARWGGQQIVKEHQYVRVVLYANGVTALITLFFLGLLHLQFYSSNDDLRLIDMLLYASLPSLVGVFISFFLSRNLSSWYLKQQTEEFDLTV